jgi:hypothetical protein
MFKLIQTRYRNAVARGLVTLTLFLFCPATVSAIPIAEYHENLKKAILALETLFESGEDETTEDYALRFNAMIAGVREALPVNQQVEINGEVCNVDNSWLHKALDELDESADTLEKLGEIHETLEAIEERVAERQNAVAALESKSDAKSRLESILARPEYAAGARGPNALSRLIQDFLRRLESLFPERAPMEPGRANWISSIAQVIVILVAVAVLAYAVRILLGRFKRSGKLKPRKQKGARVVLGERLEPEETATDLLSEAEALARRGDLRAAIRKAYIAMLVELGDRKLINLAQHKTNRDYLNSLRSVPHLHVMMRALTDSFERHWYGFAPATPDDWQDFRAGYVAALHAEN